MFMPPKPKQPSTDPTSPLHRLQGSLVRGMSLGVAETGVTEEAIPSDAPSRLRGSLARAALAVELSHEAYEAMPTYDAMRPEPHSLKTFTSDDGKVELRQHSTEHHQDGVAYNPTTRIVAVCDGMGGIGPTGSKSKDNFAFELAHAAAELDNIHDLTVESNAAALIQRARAILENMKFPDGSRLDLATELFRAVPVSGIVLGSTLAAVQQIGDTNVWRVVTFGDSTVTVLDHEGGIREQFGELQQVRETEGLSRDGTVADNPLASRLGFTKGIDPSVRYSKKGSLYHAVFSEVTLSPGERIVVTSDAYFQKSREEVFLREVGETNAEWAALKPLHSDDTTMAIVHA